MLFFPSDDYVSKDVARNVYGVVIGADGRSVDAAATAQLRSSMRQAALAKAA